MPMPASRSAVTSALHEAHLDARLLDTLAGAIEGALDDVDPVTSHPRSARRTPQTPLPVPMSSAGP